jgi:hypothetical protein
MSSQIPQMSCLQQILENTGKMDMVLDFSSEYEDSSTSSASPPCPMMDLPSTKLKGPAQRKPAQTRNVEEKSSSSLSVTTPARSKSNLFPSSCAAKSAASAIPTKIYVSVPDVTLTRGDSSVVYEPTQLHGKRRLIHATPESESGNESDDESPQGSRKRAKRGTDKSKTALKKEGVEQRKEIKELKAKLEESEWAIRSKKSCLNLHRTNSVRPQNLNRAEQQKLKNLIHAEQEKVKKLENEPKEYRLLNGKLTAENNELKSTAGKTMLSILQEEVKGQLDGMRSQWAKFGTPPRTADVRVHAGTQTEDDGMAKERKKLSEELEEIIRSTNKEMASRNLVRLVHNQNDDLIQEGLRAKFGKAMALLGKLEKLDGRK